jgi:hypothetical protein
MGRRLERQACPRWAAGLFSVQNEAMTMINRIVPWISGTLALTLAVVAQAGTTWDGGGSTDAKWTTPANWDGNTPPAFDGTADITIGTVHASGTLMVLDGAKPSNP